MTNDMPIEDTKSRADADEPREKLSLPPGLTDSSQAYPTIFIDTGGAPLADAGSDDIRRVSEALKTALDRVHPEAIDGQGLIKTHIGEPSCITRMRPEFIPGSVEFLEKQGASGVAAGDTTVAYTGSRGHRENPPGDAKAYMALAEKHGWSSEGAAGVPFVVLDRPCTSQPGVFEFDTSSICREVDGVDRFGDFFRAGGFEAADFVVNHAHLTLHGLAGVAGCVKSLAMGCTSIPGKLRMHKSLLPGFDEELCVLCGKCVDNCPEDALVIEEDAQCPTVLRERCIGCGECVSLCALTKGAISLERQKISDWQLGQDSLTARMTDYTVGMMNGKWDSTVHVLHLYTVTKLCDCVDVRQKPMVARDMGFLVGGNPFAVDLLAGRMLAEAVQGEDVGADPGHLKSAEQAAAYAHEAYGIITETTAETLPVSLDAAD